MVNEAEIAKIIEEMGPVESAEEKAAGAAPEGAAEQAPPYAGPQPRKRLFNIREGAMWAGVCNGIAAYINVDVTWVRIAFALITIFSWGGMILVYIAAGVHRAHGEHRGGSRRRVRHALQHRRAHRPRKKKL